ncbi:MAG: right-handed parallel beta-helix repeat-containing protein, partial [Deltaproteobacteria bacterium]|nr:right-handed parallel beta-helix repeat-containing protein [Deltaproteobacteria bacterium]MBW2531795.1 right-handed parallel beta-helix repeat-containing protein [Deltaproteobacteria bacterium]
MARPPSPAHCALIAVAVAVTLAPLRAAAETYYVRADGDDAADGLSDATAWATVSRVNQFSFAAGDDVYFRCGDVWTAQALTIDWSGTDQDPVVVGAYHLAGGQETVGVNGDGRPLFDGDWVDIDGINKPLIDLRAEHVVVQDMHVYDSYGIGLRISGGFMYNTIRRCKSDLTGRAAISVYNTSHNVVEHCEASRASIHYTLGNISTWGSTIAVYNAPDNVVRYCEAHDNVGEGINLVRGSHRSVAEYNYVWANYSVGIYVDSASDCTVRHNLVVGTTDPEYHYIEGWHGMGIAVNNEVTSHGASNNTTFLGNVVIGRHSGIRFMNAQAMPTSNLRVLNNTLIDNQRNFNISIASTYSNVTIRNNISYVSAADADHGAIHDGDLGTALQSNLWSSEPAAALFDGSTDLVADPLFPKGTGWRALDGRDAFATADFAVPATSPAVDSGVDLGPDYDDGMTVGTDFHAAPRTVVTVEQGTVGAGWDMGAWIYREPSAGGAGGAGGGMPGGTGGTGTGGSDDGGAAPAAAPAPTDADGGCSCRIGRASVPLRTAWLALVALAGAWLRRRHAG